jgi:hypothetical protein
MPMKMFEYRLMDLPACAACGLVERRPVGWIRDIDSHRCPICGNVAAVDGAHLLRGLAEAQEGVEQLLRDIAALGSAR